MDKLLTCVECKETGAHSTDCVAEFNKIMCDDCYTEARFVILQEQGLKDLFEVDEYLNKQDVI